MLLVYLPAYLRACFFRHVQILQVNSLEVANVIYGLGKMRARLYRSDKIEINTKNNNSTRSFLELPDLKQKSAIEFGLAEQVLAAAVRDAALSPGVHDMATALAAAAEDMSEEGDEAAPTSRKLAKRVRAVLHEALGREAWRVTAQGLSNSLYGLVLMGASWADLPLKLREILLSTLGRELESMDEQAVSPTLSVRPALPCST